MKNREHTVETLIRERNCQIDRCSCGQYHVSLGAITVHMEAEEFLTMAHAIQMIDWESQSLVPR